jgi:hypothetical protein
MLTHEKLINKGFELNEYKEGKYYELEETEETKIQKILMVADVDYNPESIDEKVILQTKEDFNNPLICVDCDVWELTEEEFESILDAL